MWSDTKSKVSKCHNIKQNPCHLGLVKLELDEQFQFNGFE